MSGMVQFGVVFLLSAAQFLSDKINIERSRYREHVSSFAAAIAITYLLFNLMPKVYAGSSGLVLFIPMIIGFAFIHLLEKWFFSSYKERFHIRNAKTFHDELHAFILFIYHFIIGAVLIGVMEKDILTGLLFLPPLLLFTTIGNWSLHHDYLRQIPYRRLLLASSTILGALFASSTLTNPTIEKILINFAAGILLFIVVRESLPKPKQGKSMLFISGIVFYGILVYFIERLLG